MKIFSKPITIKEANEFIKLFHRHHRPTIRNSGRWALAAVDELNQIIGVVIAGNPVSATYMDSVTIELTRLCVSEGAPKGTCSFLLAKCCAIWRVMGGKELLHIPWSLSQGPPCEALDGSVWMSSSPIKDGRTKPKWMVLKEMPWKYMRYQSGVGKEN